MSHQVIRASAALLICDRDSNVLVLRTTYKDHWELPGGGVEPDETPADAAAREADEELGLAVRTGRLLCVDYARPRADRPVSMLHFVFEGPPAEQLDLDRITHPADEISGHLWATPEQAIVLLGLRLGPRCRHALRAAATGRTFYLEDGGIRPA
ncbi:MAG TPA: NUDIX hydrolase [Acidimicrobiales bacterium]|nr:NUDIX hydrolase [Acidimicrobiales bacterium]